MGETRYLLHNPEPIAFTDGGRSAADAPAQSPCALSVSPTGSRLLYVTVSKYENDWNSEMHNHHFLELFYVLSGSGKFLIGNQSFPVSPCDLVIVNPHVLHTEQTGGVPLSYIVLGIDGLAFSFADPQEQFCVTNYTHVKNDIQRLFDMLVYELRMNQPYKAEYCQYVLSLLLIQIIRNSNIVASVVASRQVSSVIDSVRQYIDANFKLALTLEQLAEQSHLSKFYLVHHFKDAFGISPISYLLQKRIDESKHLLRTTDHSLFRIAQVVGFSSASYFSQSFRKTVGLSPLEYRKRFKAEPVEVDS